MMAKIASSRLHQQSIHLLSKPVIIISVIAILLTGALLRFSELGAESYWLDEVIMIRITTQDFDSIVQHLQESDRPPVYVLLSYGWTTLFGSSEAAVRSLSAVAGILSLGMIFLIGRSLFDIGVALTATLIMTLSSFQVWYAQENRYYSVEQLAVLIAAYGYIQFLQRQRFIHMALFVIFCIVSVYTHSHAVFFIAALGLHFLFRCFSPSSASIRTLWIISQVVIFVGILPQVIKHVSGLAPATPPSEVTLGEGTGVSEWLSVPPFYAPVRTLLNFLVTERRTVELSFVAAAAVVFIGGMALVISRRGVSRWIADLRQLGAAALSEVHKLDDRLLLLACWLVVPLVLPFVISLTLTPLYYDRYLIPAAPAWYLVIAVLINGLHRAVPRWLSTSVLMLILAGSLLNYYRLADKEQWRESAAYLEANIAPAEPFAISYGEVPGEAFNIRNSLFWYYNGQEMECYVDVRQTESLIVQQLRDCAQGQKRIWLVMYSARLFEDASYVQQFPDLSPYGADMITMNRFVGVTVLLFELNTPA
jgi:mannosyltransferase